MIPNTSERFLPLTFDDVLESIANYFLREGSNKLLKKKKKKIGKEFNPIVCRFTGHSREAIVKAPRTTDSHAISRQQRSHYNEYLLAIKANRQIEGNEQARSSGA
jgi:hypothetical protein